MILIGLSSWSYFDIWAPNVDELPRFFPIHFIVWLAVFLSIGTLVAGVTYAAGSGPTRGDRAYAVAAVTLVLIQSWDNRLIADTNPVGRWIAFGAVFAVVVLLTYRLVPAFPHLRAIFGVLTVFLVGAHYLTALSFGFDWLTADHTMSEDVSPAILGDGTLPDVFVVVLDEYGRGDVLRESFGYDNASFEAELASAGLVTLPGATSNYTSTILSVAGLLDGQYPAIGAADDPDQDKLHQDPLGRQQAVQVRWRQPATRSTCSTMRGRSPNADQSWMSAIASSSTILTVSCCRGPRSPTSFPPLQIYSWTSGSFDQLRQAEELARTDSDRPRLVYLHALIPHGPMQLDAGCDTYSPALGTVGSIDDTPETRRAYAEQVECVNTLVVALVDAIPDDAIVFITGDHGPRLAGADPRLESRCVGRRHPRPVRNIHGVSISGPM